MPKAVNRDDKPSTASTPTPAAQAVAENTELTELRELVKSQASQLDELRDLIRDIRSNPTPTPAAQAVADKREKPIEKLERRIREQDERRQAVDAELAAGNRQFEVSMAGEPRMTRLVGATSDHEARGKYIAYFGITGTSAAISVKEVGVAEDSSSPTPNSPGTMARR